MALFTLLTREIDRPLNRLSGLTVISGIANVFLIGIINATAGNVANYTVNWKFFIYYLIFLIIFIFTKRYVLNECSDLVELAVAKIRYRLADQIRRTDFSNFEKQSASFIYSRLSQDAIVISSVTNTVIACGVQPTILIVFTMIYIGTVSLLSCAIISAGIALGLWYYMNHAKIYDEMWRLVSRSETAFFSKLEHILKGFKEIKINSRTNEKVFKDYVKVNNTIRVQRSETNRLYITNLIFAQVFLYLLLCVILYGLPKIHVESSITTIKVVAAVLFIIAPLEGVLYAIPLYAKANSAAENMMELEEMLEKMGESPVDIDAPPAHETLAFKNSIEIKGLGFQYPDTDGHSFHVGPVNLKMQKGELIFITGGNGSGKSTFLKMFTWLYHPSVGQIELDNLENKGGTVITAQNHQQYQNLFAIIFTDYHLFDKLYGSEKQPDLLEVKNLLQKMELSETITTYKDGGFTNINLSSGQKKRLALTAVILEDKDIYIFDEVAADLDPEFRDIYYYEILPELKSRNKIILVVSHDQQYWPVADRILNFQDGVMKEITKKKRKS